MAVLPFTNMSSDPEQEYFADGMVEEIITALSRLRWLFVIAHNSSFTYKGRAIDVKQVGRELGVRYVLEGSVRKSSSRVRITGQLIDASTGVHLSADRFDGAMEDGQHRHCRNEIYPAHRLQGCDELGKGPLGHRVTDRLLQTLDTPRLGTIMVTRRRPRQNS